MLKPSPTKRGLLYDAILIFSIHGKIADVEHASGVPWLSLLVYHTFTLLARGIRWTYTICSSSGINHEYGSWVYACSLWFKLYHKPNKLASIVEATMMNLLMTRFLKHSKGVKCSLHAPKVMDFNPSWIHLGVRSPSMSGLNRKYTTGNTYTSRIWWCSFAPPHPPTHPQYRQESSTAVLK